MGYYLSEEEAKLSRTISNIASTLPEQLGEFAQYLEFEKHKSLGFIYEKIRDIRLFYQVISSESNTDIMDIEPDTLSELTVDFIEKYISEPDKTQRLHAQPLNPSTVKRTKRKHSLWYYYEYLKFKKLVCFNPIIQGPQTGRPKTKKTIDSPDKVKFTGDAKIKTTIDGKYSIIKEYNPDSSQSKYIYIIKDEENGQYLTDESGNTLSIIPYMEARNFVKHLYKMKE